MDWRCGSRGRVTDLQVWRPEFKPLSHQKKKKKIMGMENWNLTKPQAWMRTLDQSLMVPWVFIVFVISPFVFLILLIWVFSLLILVRFARGLSIFFIFSKNQLFVLLILCMFVLVSISLILASIFIISLLLDCSFLVLVFLRVWDVALGHWFEIFLSF
jgi:hypothetical protein